MYFILDKNLGLNSLGLSDKNSYSCVSILI